MLGTGFKNQENILNDIPALNRARENILQRLTKAVNVGVTYPDAR